MLGQNGTHGFWFKNWSLSMTDWFLNGVNAKKTQIYPNRWLKEKLPWSKKTPRKGTATRNCIPIMCLPMIWKILTAQIKEEICYLLVCRRLFLEEAKGFHKGTTYTKEELKETEKSSHSVDRLQKDLRFDPAKLDNLLSKKWTRYPTKK